MSGTHIPRGLFFAIVLGTIAQCVHDFPLLPDRLASHFAASGMPNGWMTKTQFLGMYGVVLMPALAIEFWVSHRIANKPAARLNLPDAIVSGVGDIQVSRGIDCDAARQV